MHAFFSHTRVCSLIVCVMFCLGHFETESWFFFFAYAERIASMILSTARFLSIPYAEICVNVTAGGIWNRCWEATICWNGNALNPFTPKFKKVKKWKAMFFIVIFLVRLQGKFDIITLGNERVKNSSPSSASLKWHSKSYTFSVTLR